MDNKQEILAEIIRLAQRHHISSAEITDAMVATSEDMQNASTKSSIAMRLFAYLGGIFVFAGIGTYIAMFWGDMNSAMRVIITFGSGFVLYILGIASMIEERYHRVVTPILLVSAHLQPAGLLVAIDEYFNSGSDPRYALLLVFSFMFIQQGLTWYAKRYSILLFTTMAFGCLLYVTICDLLDVDEELLGLTLGISLLCLTYGINKAIAHPTAPLWYFIGSILLFWSVFDLVEHSMLELSYLFLCAFMLYISTTARSRTLLFTSTFALLSFIGY